MGMSKRKSPRRETVELRSATVRLKNIRRREAYVRTIDVDSLPEVCSIELTQGKVAIVSRCDYVRLSQFKWRARKNKGGSWYAHRSQQLLGSSAYRNIYMHREILDAPAGIHVDHRDGDGLNNTRANLRLATPAENAHNARKHRRNKSGFRGVSWCQRAGKWQVHIACDGKRKNLGVYPDLLKAATAYDNAARVLHGEFATLNFPYIHRPMHVCRHKACVVCHPAPVRVVVEEEAVPEN